MSVCTAHAKIYEHNAILPSYGTINTNTAILGLLFVEKTPLMFDVIAWYLNSPDLPKELDKLGIHPVVLTTLH